MSNKISRFVKLDSYINPAIHQSDEYVTIIDDSDILDDWTLEDYRLLTNWKSVNYDGWRMFGTKEQYWWCGMFQTKGCLHVEDHNGPEHEGAAYIVRYQRSCFRKDCEKCYERSIARQTARATRRVEKYAKKTNKKIAHYVLSISYKDSKLSFEELRIKARKILKELSIDDSALIFHPFRFHKKILQWYFSPHFHTVGFGTIPMGKIKSVFRKYGWYIKDLGPRKSIAGTFYYLLAHTGVKKGFHVVSWLGGLSYSKAKIEKEPNRNKCPACERNLVEVFNINEQIFQENDVYEGYMKPDGWHEAKDYDSLPNQENNFEYSSLAVVNETLKGITEAN